MAGALSSVSPWYVAMTKPRQEALALQHLANQGYTAWLPMHTGWRRKAGCWEVVRSPLFPRYVFVKPVCSDQGIGPVRSTVGISALVRFGNQLATASDALIQALYDVEARLAEAVNAEGSPFQRGDRVRIIDDLFSGVEGIVSSLAEERVVVLLNILGREQSVQFSPAKLVQASGQ